MRIQLNLMSRGYSEDFDEQDIFSTLTLGPNPYLVPDQKGRKWDIGFLTEQSLIENFSRV